MPNLPFILLENKQLEGANLQSKCPSEVTQFNGQRKKFVHFFHIFAL